MTPDSAQAAAGIDLGQFHHVFFEEAAENLDRLERSLIDLDPAQPDDETLNAVFRCAHSIKGGAATFGFADVASLTHEMETLLDRLRRRELAPTPGMVDVLLLAGDALGAQLARHRGAGGDAVDTKPLAERLRHWAGKDGGVTPCAPAGSFPDPACADPTPATRRLELRIGPMRRATDADDLARLFDEIADLGTIAPLDGGHAVDGCRRFCITTISSDAELIDLFGFHVAREHLALSPLGPEDGQGGDSPPEPGAADGSGAAGTAPVASIAAAALSSPAPAARAARTPATEIEAATLRVPVDKVDRLINLVGELVITQAMLAQRTAGLDPAVLQALAAGLADLDRTTRDLQQSVMSIRMMPMSDVFNRFPRVLRDLAARLGKQVGLALLGEATELDKGLVEKITDPLTHLVRNALDHGIEPPAERIARGKDACGTITLGASHQGGSIVIEVRDDGRGLSRAKLLAKARSRGIDAPDAMSDAEVWQLIFAPGFSTAETVTDLSGRGVGMDVVKRTIAALGGTVEVESAEGHGMRVSVRLPLTLAIMDGMSIGVADEVYIVPLASVVDTFQVRPGSIRSLGATARVVEARGEYIPVLDIDRLFATPSGTAPTSDPPSGAIIVIVEAEGSRAALLVERLIGQQQVVVKNLEANYRKVEHVSGATILGDGRVALILDVAAVVRQSRH